MFRTVANLSALPSDVPVHVEIDGVDLVLVRSAKEVALFESRCPHQGAMLHEGSVKDGLIVCHAHGWAFDRKSGQCRHDPNNTLRAIPLLLDGDDVRADIGAVNKLRLERQTFDNDVAETKAKAPPRSIEDLPGPKPLPMLGNMHQIDLDQLHITMENWQERYGSFFKFKIMNKLAIAVGRPDLIEMVLRERPHNFRRSINTEVVFEEMGAQGVFSVEGEVWRHQRRLLVQALSAKQIRAFFPKMQDITCRLMRRWHRAAGSEAPVDVQSDLRRYTVDVTSNLSFNYDINTIENDGDAIQDLLEHVFPMINRRVNAIFPYWRYFKLKRDREFDKAMKELKTRIDEIIEVSRDRLQRDGAENGPANLIEALLLAQETQGTISNADIFGNVFTLLLAGEDTTANTLVWILHFLSQHPDVFARLRQEADEVLGDQDVLSDIDASGRLRYHDAVITEALRLKPVAPVWPLETCADVIMDDVAVPAGTPLFLLTRAPGLTDFDGTPATQFDPNRWLTKNRQVSHLENVMVPFGGGPRLCPGRSLALLEIRSVVSMVARNFDLSPATDGPPVGERLAFTLIPTNVRVIFNARSDSHPFESRNIVSHAG